MNFKLIKLVILLIFFSVNIGYSSTEEIEDLDKNDPNVLKFLNKRNIDFKKPPYDEPGYNTGLLEYSLRSAKQTKYLFLMYFKTLEKVDYRIIDNRGQNFSILKDITFDSLTDANFLDTLYSNIPLKLKNKKKILVWKSILSRIC